MIRDALAGRLLRGADQRREDARVARFGASGALQVGRLAQPPLLLPSWSVWVLASWSMRDRSLDALEAIAAEVLDE